MAAGNLPAPGDKVKTARHGRQVVAVVMAGWDREHRPDYVPLMCTCGCGTSSIATVRDLTYVGTGPPS